MADSTPKSYHTDPTLWLYTSLTAGSSQIITATSRLEGILKANKIPFKALDVATDEKARMLWGRRAGKRKLPGLVRMGMIVGNYEEVEEWNEYGELKENIGSDTISTSTPSAANTPSKAPPFTSSTLQTPQSTTTNPPASAPTSTSTIASPAPHQPPQSTVSTPLTLAMRQAGHEAAKKAGDSKKASLSAKPLPSTLAKLDNSGPTGLPPPSGTTFADSAIASETRDSTATSKADDVPATTASETTAESRPSLFLEGEGQQEYMKHRASSVSLAGKEEIKKAMVVEQEDEQEDEDMETTTESKAQLKGTKKAGLEKEKGEGEVKTLDATTKGDEADGLPSGSKNPQEQGAGIPADVGESVLD
ncbi:MAG: hypothetical protein Q9187_008669 [Circinaria calcarea]